MKLPHQRYRSARLDVLERASWRAVKASDYLHHLAELVEKGGVTDVVLHVRVSWESQVRSGNDIDNEDDSRRRLAALGCRVKETFREVPCKGTLGPHRTELHRAIAYARMHRLPLVTLSRCRFLRSELFYLHRIDAVTHDDYRALLELAPGVQLATLIHPNCSARSEQTLRGIRSKKANVGRPPKMDSAPGWTIRRRQKWQNYVRKHLWAETPLRVIAAHVNSDRRWPHSLVIQTLLNWFPKEGWPTNLFRTRPGSESLAVVRGRNDAAEA